MTKRELAGLVLKLLGVYAVILSLPMLQGVVGVADILAGGHMSFLDATWLVAAVVGPFVLTAGAGVVLLVRGDRIASWIAPEDKALAMPGDLTGPDLQAIGFAVVGVLVLVQAAPQLCRFAVNLYWMRAPSTPDHQAHELARSAWGGGLAAAVQCTIGLFLFFRSRGLANLWRSIQIARYVKIEDAEADE